MSESNSENSWNPTSASSNLPDLGPSVPPPPPEVRVRTFRSDVESMSQSGGMQAQFRNVPAPVISKEGAAFAEAVTTNKVKIIVAVVVAIALTAGVAFFAYRLFFSGNSAGGLSPSPTPPPAGGSPSAKPSGAASFVHASVFKKPPDQVLALTLPSDSVGDASDLATFSQRIEGVLREAKASASFLEVNVKDKNGTDLPLADILRAGDMEVIDPTFFAAHFNPDGSLFVYRNTSGSWPGLVFTLTAGDNWLFVKDDVAKLESSLKFMNLFLTVPGTPAKEGFQDTILKDTVVENQSVRMLEFSATGTAFVYGWFRNALIISTSEEGFREAMGRL